MINSFIGAVVLITPLFILCSEILQQRRLDVISKFINETYIIHDRLDAIEKAIIKLSEKQ